MAAAQITKSGLLGVAFFRGIFATGREHTACGELACRWNNARDHFQSSLFTELGKRSQKAFCIGMLRIFKQVFRNRLFHDLAELLTRDIITPVKRSVAELPKILHQYEAEELHRKILDPLEKEGYGHIRERLAYYLGLETHSEFNDTCCCEDGIRQIDGFDALHSEWNSDDCDPKDGRLIKACDILAAFIEAYSSIHNGIGSPQLYEAMARMRRETSQLRFGSFSLATLLADFD